MLPREIQTEHWPDRLRFDLPMRPIGALRWIGAIPMLFAVAFVWMPGKQLVHALESALSQNGGGFEWIFVVFLSVFVLVGLIPFGLGLFVLIGRTRLVVTNDHIIVTEIAGPIRRSRTLRFAQIERLEIGVGPGGNAPTLAPSLLGLGGIGVVLKSGKKSFLVIGYPRDWITPLAEEISDLIHQRGEPVTVQEMTPIRAAAETIATETVAQKPAGATAQLTETINAAEFMVPSRGLFKDSYGLLGFGIVWCMIVGTVSVAFVFKGARGFSLGEVFSGPSAFISLFWAIGLGMLLLGIHLGTRRWTLRADHSRLSATMKSALRSAQWEWRVTELEDVRIGDSGTRVNNRVIEQLQVHARTGRNKTGLLSGRDHEELAWIATTLRHALQLRATDADAPPALTGRRRDASLPPLKT